MNAGGEEAVLFGGTFDPPHLGHLAAVRGLRGHTGLPLLVVPTGTPGHRSEPEASGSDRLAMVTLALAELGDAGVSVLPWEVERPGPSFTLDTVERLRQEEPGRGLVLALGMDAAAGLPSWREVTRLLAQVRLLVFRRSGVAERGPELLARLGRLGLPVGGAELVSMSLPELGGSRVRERVAAGQDCSRLLSPGVLDYIRDHGLYRPDGSGRVASGAG